MTCIERNSRYWVSATVGQRDQRLFEQGVQLSWQWAKSCQFARWFSDGERRYANQLWKLASLYLGYRECPNCRHRKVWREGLEVAAKGKHTTPAMVMGFVQRPIKMEEFLNLRGFAALTKLKDQCD